MSKNVFLDANILIDVNDKKRLTHANCLMILDYLVKNNYNIYTSCDLITTIYYLLSKTNREKALQDLEQLNKLCTIIEFSNKELLQTTILMRENKKFKDLEDSIQYVLALNTQCDCIISNDKKFYSPNIDLLSSNNFLKKFGI